MPSARLYGLALYHGLGVWPDAGQEGEYVGDAGRCAQRFSVARPRFHALRPSGRNSADGGGGDAVKNLPVSTFEKTY